MSTIGNTSAAGPSTGSGAPEGASSTTGQAKEKVQETAQQAAGEARGQMRRQVDQRSTDAGERVNATADDVRSVAQHLREEGKDQPAKLAEQAADRAERLGSYLKDSDSDRILRDIEDFGRRQPWAVMFGGLAAGFLASRFLKASSARRYESDYARTPRPSGANGGGPQRGVLPPATTVPPATAASPVPPAGTVPPVRSGAPGAGEPGPVVPPPASPASDIRSTGGALPPEPNPDRPR